MGGKSKSSSSTTTTTITEDNRIAATDSAIVLSSDGGALTLTDPGALAFGELALNGNTDIILKVLDGVGQFTKQTYEAAGFALDKAFEFKKDTTENPSNTGTKSIAPYLLLGVSVLAITGAFKK